MASAERFGRTAVIIRTHVANAKVDDLVRSLSGSSVYDLYIATNGVFDPGDFGGHPQLPYSLDAMNELGFDFSDGACILHLSDLLFSVIREKIPAYSFYIMVEHDVWLTRSAPDFMETLVERLAGSEFGDVDLVAPGLRAERGEWWMWYAACHRHYPDVRAIFFPIVGLSDRAISHLKQERLAERDRLADDAGHAGTRTAAGWIYCEAFTPSALHAAPGYRSVDLLEAAPGCYASETFTIGLPRALQPRIGLDPALEVMHPVYAAPDFLERRLAHAGAAVDARLALGDYLDRLDSGLWPMPKGLDEVFHPSPDLRACFRSKALERLAQLDAAGFDIAAGADANRTAEPDRGA